MAGSSSQSVGSNPAVSVSRSREGWAVATTLPRGARVAPEPGLWGAASSLFALQRGGQVAKVGRVGPGAVGALA